MNELRELLNRLLWNPAENTEKGEYLIGYRDGEAEQEIRLDGIAKVDSFGFTTVGDIYIPLHRIRVVKKGKEILWRKAHGKGSDNERI